MENIVLNLNASIPRILPEDTKHGDIWTWENGNGAVWMMVDDGEGLLFTLLRHADNDTLKSAKVGEFLDLGSISNLWPIRILARLSFCRQ